MIIEA